MENGMKDYLNIFKVLSDENRLRILLMLRKRPLCVCEIYEVLNIALSTISAHLKNMRNIGLIEDMKDGRWVIYRLVEKESFLMEILERLEGKLEKDPVINRDLVTISKITREICSSKLNN